MTSVYREIDFEAHIESQLLASGYVKRLPAEYDKDLCLIPAESLAFLQQTQPREWEKLEKQYGANTAAKLLERLAGEVSRRGTLDVLRKGVKDRGAKFQLAYFKPASGLNPEHEALYRGNRFSLVRQLKYSQKNENSIDMVLFLNGLPLLTIELKNSLSGQTVENAKIQYRKDRNPAGEPFLAFKRCLVHFAVGNEAAFMTTGLGERLYFLPFNRETVNPANPEGHKTHYLWEDTWQPDTLLELLHNYLCLQTVGEKVYNEKSGQVEEKTSERLIFPRFHQLDAVRALLGLVRQEGVGHNYLVQHSAGSGKSNSIAWLAHQLASFYQNPSDTERLFDSIVVVTDRRVLDKQLQDTIKQFEQTEGVVMPIEKDSAQLRAALQRGKDIIITTLQKFPLISETMSDLKGRRFAVIIDEAHSSQSGEAASHLKKTLSANLEQAEAEDATGDDLEDSLLREIRARGPQTHISYFAFTATPKNKTLELFGRKTADGFVAHHIYSMRQAIEEGFILDVLQNYTTFSRYFKLIKKIPADNEYEKKKAIRLLTSHVDLLPHAIETKTRLMLEHFLEKTVHEIRGRARAMVVTRSRLHAVKFYQAFQKIMAERGLGFKALVAFSGEVKDPETGLKFTENSLNRLPPKVSIVDAFKTPDYRILVVANKFQTGFDEPLLHTMYVDKRLAGVQAVQTLSRLNRNRSAKNGTLVLDFVNEAEDIQAAFQPYYQTTLLEEETDPNLLYSLQAELEAFEVFTAKDVRDFAEIFFTPQTPLEKLQPVLDRVVTLWGYKQAEQREAFRGTLQKYIRLYGFLSQLVTFEDVELEELYVFARALNRKLPRRENSLPYEIRDAVDLDSFRIQETYAGSLELEKEDGLVKGFVGDLGGAGEDETDLLSHIVTALNETYGLNLSDEDRVDMQMIRTRLEADEDLLTVLQANNPRDAKIYKFNQVLDRLLLEFVHTKLDLYKKLTDPKVNDTLKRQWFEKFVLEMGGG